MARIKITKRKGAKAPTQDKNKSVLKKNAMRKQSTTEQKSPSPTLRSSHSSSITNKSPSQSERLHNKAQTVSYTRRQMRQWKVMDNQLREELETMVDGNVKLVSSRSRMAGNSEVQQTLRDVSRVLKVKLKKILVPSSANSNYGKLRNTLTSLEEEVETNNSQTQELEKAIRMEERQVEKLEDIQDSTESVHLDIQVPSDKLDLPRWLT